MFVEVVVTDCPMNQARRDAAPLQADLHQSSDWPWLHYVSTTQPPAK
jgi:hypothetical protein